VTAAIREAAQNFATLAIGRWRRADRAVGNCPSAVSFESTIV